MAWVHQIHTAGGVGGFTTMVMVLFVWFMTRDHKLSHPGLHHTLEFWFTWGVGKPQCQCVVVVEAKHPSKVTPTSL
jgi:hypothetical protein